MVIAKRSVSLAKTYPVLGVALSLVGVGFASLSGLVGAASSGIPAGVNATASASTVNLGLPFLAVSFQGLAATLVCTPVLMLFVYDKNNGILEYLMSLGMDQRDIYRQYLKASLILGAAIAAFDVAVDLVVGVIEGEALLGLEISGLVVAVALAAVSFGTLAMMAFSSLQKQRMGSNQPLGLAIGAFLIMPSYFLPLVDPSKAFWVDLLLAGVIVGLSLITYPLASRLISREKLLP